MNLNFFDHRETIAKNLVTFLRMKGYSKLSLSKLSDISRPTIDQILKGEGLEYEQYNKQIGKIINTFDLPDNYFINPLISIAPTTYTCSIDFLDSERDPRVKELLDGLDNILDIYSLYLK
jgi:transcriptional regulator with XRE-family HTH domain